LPDGANDSEYAEIKVNCYAHNGAGGDDGWGDPDEVYDIVKIVCKDTTAPSGITDLTALTGNQGGEISLSWSAPGDDGTTGQITNGKWRIDYSTYSKVWSVDDYQIEIATSCSPSSVYNYVLTGLTSGSTYYIRIWSGDEVPNWSDASNIVSAIPPSGPGIYLNKTADIFEAVPGSTVTYTITYSNQGDTTAQNVLIQDQIPSQAQYITGSIFLNGVNKTDALDGDEADYNQTLTGGISVNIGNLSPQEQGVVKFKVQVP
jgi:uncharacterized repeat protein (TIGR01451 family)